MRVCRKTNKSKKYGGLTYSFDRTQGVRYLFLQNCKISCVERRLTFKFSKNTYLDKFIEMLSSFSALVALNLVNERQEMQEHAIPQKTRALLYILWKLHEQNSDLLMLVCFSFAICYIICTILNCLCLFLLIN